MASIYDIPRKDIEIFLLANKKNVKGNNDDYKSTQSLLKDNKSKGHTTSIVEWMIAHNLLLSKVNIPIYTTKEIDNMSQVQINKLSKLLTMKTNNIDSIKSILRYLDKLDKEFLLPEINSIILNNLYDIEKNDEHILFNIQHGYFDNIIRLLKTHHNKKLIRELIIDNMEKMLGNNYDQTSFMIELLELNELGLAKKVYDYNRSIDFEWENFVNDIVSPIYLNFKQQDKLERLFKVIPSSDLFWFIKEEVKNVEDINSKLENLCIPFLETAIELKQSDFVSLMLDYLNNEFNLTKMKDLVGQLDDLTILAEEII